MFYTIDVFQVILYSNKLAEKSQI